MDEKRGKPPDSPEPPENEQDGVRALVNPGFVDIGDFPLARGLVPVKGEPGGRLPLNRGKEYFPAAVRADVRRSGG